MASSRKSPKNSTLLARTTAVVERHMQCGERLAVGLSGGIDSVVLLDLLQRIAQRGGIELTAVHVNHQLNPAADAWARFCRALCRDYGIPLSVKKVEVRRGNSLEASARAARYAVYAGVKCDAVALAHNQDDQVETLLLQLLRGTSSKGRSSAGFSILNSGIALTPLTPLPRSSCSSRVST
jgi:tRNA(Ile)-lysidine synthase